MRSAHITVRLFFLLALLAGCARTPTAPPAPPAQPPKQQVDQPQRPPTANPEPAKPVPATVTLQFRYGDAWRTATALESHLPVGPAELRLLFSKPVQRDEVEQALKETQPAPVRGVMQWADDRTLVWRVVQMPPRVDFLLGEAHDQDGVALPGGIPSLRVGQAPSLVTADPGSPGGTVLTTLPPDIVSAALSPDRKHLNLTVWTPGSTRWDWQTTELSLNLESRTLQKGRVDGFQPRLPANLESWALNPAGNLVAGLRASAKPGERDLVTSDVLGARQQAIPGFVRRSAGAGTAGIAWSGDGARIAALSESSPGSGQSDLVTFEMAARTVSTLARDLPVPAGTARLAWSADGRYLVAGNVLVDLQGAPVTRLPGDPAAARGIWEPEGSRLLYGVRDWGPVQILDAATGTSAQLGDGLAVGWAAPGQAYLVRWPAAETRYLPLGQ